MRLLSVCVVVASLISAAQGQGFLADVMSLISRLNPFTQQQQSSRPAAPVFRPRPAPAEPAPAPASDPMPFSGPVTSPQAAPAPVPQPPPNFSFGRLRIQPIATPGRGNHNFEGRSYLLSWREEGRPRYTWAQARDFCSSAGMRLLSLDTAAKVDHFLGLAATQGVGSLWTGGRLSQDKRTVSWESGVQELVTRGLHPWSPQGLRGPQPDGEGSEHCVAILNNVYNDGVKLHDVGCDHDKPTICEN